MNYRSATNYLNNYINFEVKPATAYAPEKFNLNRVRNIIKRIGSPHLQYPSVHIAGTKGKGSVAAALLACEIFKYAQKNISL